MPLSVLYVIFNQLFIILVKKIFITFLLNDGKFFI